MAKDSLGRKDRLASRLRENLKRRKAQARARSADLQPSPAPDAAGSPLPAAPSIPAGERDKDSDG